MSEPERIYRQVTGGCVSYNLTPLTDTDIEYVRADVVAAREQELREALRNLLRESGNCIELTDCPELQQFRRDAVEALQGEKNER